MKSVTLLGFSRNKIDVSLLYIIALAVCKPAKSFLGTTVQGCSHVTVQFTACVLINTRTPITGSEKGVRVLVPGLKCVTLLHTCFSD